ncbi:MAG: outer membrane lipoprotein carrier protein LolA [Bacteroidales bacterium]
MKITLNISLLILLLSTLPLMAQTTTERQYEQKGEELLQQAAQKLKSYDALKISFTFRMINESQGVDEEMKGTLISQGDKYHMDAGEHVFISDGEIVWSYMSEIDEVHINLVENTEGGLTPTSILKSFEEDFRSKFIREESYQGRQVNLVDLVPTTPQAFHKYRVALDVATDMIVYTTAFDRQGGTYTYTVEEFEANPSIAGNQFTFDVNDYPGVEVIDLR